MSQFQTASNPLRTQAGNSNNGQFPLDVTTAGNQVNITTGVVNTTIANSIYTDNQLAIYQVDQVLLPLEMFGPPSPAPAPSKPKKDSPSSSSDAPSGSSSSVDAPVDSSGAMALTRRLVVSFAFAGFSL
uniref:Fasciclin-like arabinogalactan protein 11 n=1 Tax=Nelumbo nucifera TaxID=4432 RepID=A0A822YEM7_NELNU|nr:TPA_asm: hypothetical protein HUJ06_029436 [Nelumbo nucifera]